MKEILATARERMKGFCRVCPICNGKACVGEVPGMGGLDSGAAFHNNVTALAAVQLNMTALHAVSAPDTSLTLLGRRMSLPVLAAPIGGVSFNMGGAISEDDYVEAVLGGCAAEGSLGCTGDGVPPFIIDSAVKGLQRFPGIPFIKPWEGKELFEKLDRVLACKPVAVGVDVDAAGLITLRKMGRPVAPTPPARLAEIAAYVHKAGCPFIVKGIMTPADARKAVQASCDALVVSNHGGRILDHTPGAATVLPAIAKEVRGEICILADGAVRSGQDVLKLLALGADAVLIGRPFSIAALGGGQAGVQKYLQQIAQQLTQAMLLTGVGTLQDISAAILYQG